MCDCSAAALEWIISARCKYFWYSLCQISALQNPTVSFSKTISYFPRCIQKQGLRRRCVIAARSAIKFNNCVRPWLHRTLMSLFVVIMISVCTYCRILGYAWG